MPRGKHLKPEAGAKTQFGQPGGPDPRKATKSGCPKHSIRGAVRYLANKSIKEIDELGRQNEPTIAQLLGAVVLKKGLKGDLHAINFVDERLDGKLPQETQLTGKDGDALQAPVIYLPANGRDVS